MIALIVTFEEKKTGFNETYNEYYDIEKHQLSCILIYYD
jgi:hypothetical protein